MTSKTNMATAECKTSISIEKCTENQFKSNCNCAVPGCYERYGHNNISMHKLPKDREKLELWIKLCKIENNVTKNSRVCSAHFNESDFYNYHKTTRRKIRSQAIPCKRLPENDEIASKLRELARSRKKSIKRTLELDDNVGSVKIESDSEVSKSADNMLDQDEPPKTDEIYLGTAATSTTDALLTLSKSIENFTTNYREIEIAKLKMRWYEKYGSLQNFDILWT